MAAVQAILLFIGYQQGINMTIFYSKQTRGFYNTNINKVIPEDAVEVSEQVYNELLDGQQMGVTIVADENGYPVLQEPQAPTAEENKKTAISLLQKTDWTTAADIGNYQVSNPYLENQSEFISYRNAVRQYALYPIDGNIDWPQMPEQNWVKV